MIVDHDQALDAALSHQPGGVGHRGFRRDRERGSRHQLGGDGRAGLGPLGATACGLEAPRGIRQGSTALLEQKVGLRHHPDDAPLEVHHRQRAHPALRQHAGYLLDRSRGRDGGDLAGHHVGDAGQRFDVHVLTPPASARRSGPGSECGGPAGGRWPRSAVRAAHPAVGSPSRSGRRPSLRRSPRSRSQRSRRR